MYLEFSAFLVMPALPIVFLTLLGTVEDRVTLVAHVISFFRSAREATFDVFSFRSEDDPDDTAIVTQRFSDGIIRVRVDHTRCRLYGRVQFGVFDDVNPTEREETPRTPVIRRKSADRTESGGVQLRSE